MMHWQPTQMTTAQAIKASYIGMTRLTGTHGVGANEIADQQAVDEELGRQHEQGQHAGYDEFDKQFGDVSPGEFFFSRSVVSGQLSS